MIISLWGPFLSGGFCPRDLCLGKERLDLLYLGAFLLFPCYKFAVSCGNTFCITPVYKRGDLS
jgi:hypothetical protein